MKLLIDDIQRNGSRGKAELPARSTDITPQMQQRVTEDVR